MHQIHKLVLILQIFFRYVDNHLVRQTPHAFSHFTFERSGHEMIVVDVQGVGDLFIDSNFIPNVLGSSSKLTCQILNFEHLF